MKTALTLILICAAFILAGSKNPQEGYVDVKKLPIPDCSGVNTAWTQFNSNAQEFGRISVIPDEPSDPAAFAGILQYFDEVKTESELTEEDMGKAMYIFGIMGDFQDWDRMGVPITKTGKGFLFENLKYEGDRDAVCYVGDNRYAVVGNSYAPVSTLMSTMMFYDYMTIKDGLLSKMKVKDAPEIDLDKIRESNYNRLDSKYFNCFVDKELNGQESAISDAVVADICRKLELPLPNFSINAYLSADPNATRLFSNFFYMTGCDILPPDMRFGTKQLDAIHGVGMDTELVIHESVHYIWNKFIIRAEVNEFLNEGIQTYYQFLRNSDNFESAVGRHKRHLAHDMRDWIIEGSDSSFWGGPSEDGWPIAYDISGLFVKFLIDGWGMDKFKELYAFNGKAKGLKSIYGMSVDETLDGYYKWLSGFDIKI